MTITDTRAVNPRPAETHTFNMRRLSDRNALYSEVHDALERGCIVEIVPESAWGPEAVK